MDSRAVLEVCMGMSKAGDQEEDVLFKIIIPQVVLMFVHTWDSIH